MYESYQPLQYYSENAQAMAYTFDHNTLHMILERTELAAINSAGQIYDQAYVILFLARSAASEFNWMRAEAKARGIRRRHQTRDGSLPTLWSNRLETVLRNQHLTNDERYAQLLRVAPYLRKEVQRLVGDLELLRDDMPDMHRGVVLGELEGLVLDYEETLATAGYTHVHIWYH